MSLNKYFIAIVLPEPLLSKIEAIKQDLFQQHGLKGALRCPSHITLHRPFVWKGEKENLLIEKLKTFKFKDKFEVELQHFAFFEPRVIYVDVLPNETLNQLHKHLSSFSKKELKLFNESDDLRGFHPHVTVAFRDLKKPKFYELQADFIQKKLEARFNYVDFSLLKLEGKWEVLHSFSPQNDGL